MAEGARVCRLCAEDRRRAERVAERGRAVQAEPGRGVEHVVGEAVPAEHGRGGRRPVGAQIQHAAGEVLGEAPRQWSQTEGVQAGTVDEQGGAPAAAKVVGGESDTVGARDSDGRHPGTLPPVVGRPRSGRGWGTATDYK